MAERQQGTRPGLFVVSRGGHPGVDDALRRLVASGGLRQAHHHGVAEPTTSGSEAEWVNFQATIERDRVELVVLHHYHGRRSPDPRGFIEAVRSMPHRPVVALTCGDAFFNGFFRPSHPQVIRQACSHVDVVLTTSMGGNADAITGYGAPRVALWPHAADPGRFVSGRVRRSVPPEFEVVFIGSRNQPRNPFRSYHWSARRRQHLIERLTRHFGARFAVFGKGWEGLPSARGPVEFDRQLEACRRSRVVVGGVPYSPARYYMSDRPFIQTLSGVPFVDLAVDGVGTVLRDGEHWHLANDEDGVLGRCEELLARPKGDREELGRLAATFVKDNHTHEARWRGLVQDLEELHRCRLTGEAPAPPNLEFLLPEVDRDREMPDATRGWVGREHAPQS